MRSRIPVTRRVAYRTNCTTDPVRAPHTVASSRARSGSWAQSPARRRGVQTRGNDTRGQTEPLAALVAVTVVCVAVSIYAGFLSGVVPELGAERSVGEGTSERVWSAISENGLYDSGDPLRNSVETETLPQGYYVSITVTYVGDDGRLVSVAAETFDAHGDPAGVDPPADAERHERPIPIRHGPGDVRPGTLRVVVWS